MKMTQLLETIPDDPIQEVCSEIADVIQGAYASLLEGREAQLADETAPLDAEREALSKEYIDIQTAAENLKALLPAQQREAQRQADAALLAGRLEEAEAQRQEYETARHAPEAMKERQREISARIEAIDHEKKIIARSVFDEWYVQLQTIIRASEHALFCDLLNKAHDELYVFQAIHGLEGSPLLTANLSSGLTADEHSVEWKSGTSWYSGRRR
jgi:DNA repair exonuclease SbcCD ATPase subunit